MLHKTRWEKRREQYRLLPFWKRLRSEAADSLAVFILLSIPFILLFAGWTIDFTKNASVRSQYMDIAQEAAQASIREQNGNGSLLCGQTPAEEANGGTTSTAKYVIRGVDNARRFVRNASQGLSGAKPSRPSQSQALQHAVRSYLEKSGRDSDTSSVYNLGTNHGWTASANDSGFVAGMRNIVGTESDREALDNNVDSVVNVSTLTDSNYHDTFSITVWCTKGVGDADNRTGDAHSGNMNTVGRAQKFNTINLEIHDWSGNFIMGMFNPNWTVQKYTMTPRAVASWSGSAVS